MEAGLTPDAVSVGGEGDALAGDHGIEIGEAVDVGPRQEMHLLRTEPGDNLKTLGEIWDGALRLGIGEDVGRNKTRINVRVVQKS